jgi:methylated-DNA-[protein]-cysteine S-methyltransferase
MLHYTIFRTKWGYFAFAGTDDTVSRTFLPVPDRQTAERGLLLGLGPAAHDVRFSQGFLPDLQEQVLAYFEGQTVDFSVDPPVNLDHATAFGQKVLRACRAISYGRTMTYTDLARQVGSPAAARAVGGVMAANPIPLILPCHRVLRADGGLGGFSAPGGTATKHKMLEHEQLLRSRPDVYRETEQRHSNALRENT